MFHEFKCEDCGEKFEFTRKSFDDDLPDKCPKCGGSVYQVFDSVTFLWKGRFRFMRGEPEVDMDKIEAEQNVKGLKQAKGKIHRALSEHKTNY